MKNKLLILVFSAFLLQACSWRIRFLLVNSTDKPITVEIKVQENRTGFPIFHSRKLYVHEAPNNKLKDEEKEFSPDTLESSAHIKFTLAAHTAVEIGELQNDHYEKYNGYFINGRVFNLESLVINSVGKETKIIPENFDNYFKKGKYKEIYYYVK